jgi:hypothetical protein
VERWRQAGQRHRVALALRVLKGERQAARFAQREGGERRPQRLPGGDADREAPRRGVEERGHSVRRPSGHRIGAERLGTLTDGAVGVLDPDQEGVAGRSQRKGERQRLRRLGEEDVRRVVDPHHAGEDDVAAVLAAQRQHVIGLIRCARSARRAGSPGTRGALEEAPADLEAAPPEKRPADGLAENQEVGVAVVRDDGQRVVPLGMAEDEPRAARHPPLSAAAPDLPEPLPAHRQAELARSGLGLDPEDRRGRIGSVVDMEDSPILPEPGAPSRQEARRCRQGLAEPGRGCDPWPDEGAHRELGASVGIAGAARCQRLKHHPHRIPGPVEAEALEADACRAVLAHLEDPEDGTVADARPDHPLRPAYSRIDPEVKPAVGGVERAR